MVNIIKAKVDTGLWSLNTSRSNFRKSSEISSPNFQNSARFKASRESSKSGNETSFFKLNTTKIVVEEEDA